MPVLSISGDIGEQTYDDNSAGIDSTLNNNRYKIELTQNIFRGFRDQAFLNQTITKNQITIKNYEKIKQSLLLDAALSYLTVLQYQHAKVKINEKVKILNQFVDLIKKAKKSGSKTEVDVYEAQLTLQQALEQEIDINGKYLSAFGQFQSIYDYAPKTDSFSLPSAKLNLLPITLEEALDTAKSQSVVITIAQSNIDMANYEKNNVSGEFWPSIDIVGSFSEEENKEGIKGRTQDGRLYLRMEWKYNLGNQITKKVRSAEGTVSAERYHYKSVVKELEQSVNLVWQKYKTLQSRHRLTNETLKLALSVYQARLDLKSKGKGNNMAIINSNVRLINSQLAKINAEFEATKSAYSLAEKIGNIEELINGAAL